MHESVLIIDGDRRFAESTQTALAARGIVAHVESDASLESLRSIRPRVLLLNVELPRGSGFSICSRIRRDKLLCRTPILLTSSNSPLEALERHAASPDRADDYARKPVSIDDIVARIDRLLRRSREPGPAEDPRTSAGTEIKSVAPSNGAPASPVPTLPSPPTADHDDLSWQSVRIDEAIRPPTTEPDLRSAGRSTPEERLQQLRTLVKQYEAQRRAVRDLFVQLDERGLRLAERAASLAETNRAAEARIEEAERRAQEEETRRTEVEQEFVRFQEEITRIFEEKDAEEQQRRAQHHEVEVELENLRAQVTASEEQHRDDAQRLVFFQEELDAFHTSKDDSAQACERLAAELDAERKARAEMEARLSATETVADERTQEAQRLAEQLEGATSRAEKARRVLERNWTKEREILLATMAKVERDSAGERERQRALLDTLNESNEREVDALSQERDRALKDVASLQEQLQALENLRSAKSSEEARRREELEQAAADAAMRAEALAGRSAELEGDLERERARVDALESAEQATQERMESLQNALGAAQATRADDDEVMQAMQSDLSETAQALTASEAVVRELQNKIEAITEERNAARAAEHEVRREMSERSATAEKALELRDGQLEEVKRTILAHEKMRSALKEALARAGEALASEAPGGPANPPSEALQAALQRARRGTSTRSNAQSRDLQNQIAELRRANADLKSKAESQDEQLDEWRFAQSSIRNTLQSIERDLEMEDLHANAKDHLPTYSRFLSKVSRAVSMSLDALSNTELAEGNGQEPDPIPRTSKPPNAEPHRQPSAPVRQRSAPFAELIAELRNVTPETNPNQRGTTIIDNTLTADRTREDTLRLRPGSAAPEQPDHDIE